MLSKPQNHGRPRTTAATRALRGLACAVTLGLGVGGPADGAEAPDPAVAGAEHFEKEVRPILVEHCLECHSGGGGKKRRGGLALDSKAGWERGGDRGPAIVPGVLEESPLIEAIRYQDRDFAMPPKGKLSDGEIAALTRWVKEGAFDPRGGGAVPASKTIDFPKGKDLWSFRPPDDPAVPEVADATWPTSDLDRFILARLEAKGLRPAPEADRRTLIRRVTFDLTGLPPTPVEVEAFVADEAPEAFARVVDRLLGSPRYGERWGRHWLDLARYADSNGLDENVAHGNAWRYRDYVIAAFNADKPYDRFLTEQIAGDLLPPAAPPQDDHDRLIATGFLALGPKVLAETDKVKMEMDIIDEQLDTLGRTFMGLTIGCARCHDHKFDPILASDYYGLAGIFKSTQTMDSFKTIAKWHENPIATIEERARVDAHQKEVDDRKAAIRRLILASSPRLLDGALAGFVLPEASDPLAPFQAPVRLKKLQEEVAGLDKEAVELPTAMGVAEGKVADLRIHVRGSHLTLGDPAPRRVPLVLADSRAPAFGKETSGRLELARWLADPAHPLTARVMVNRIWRWHFGRGLVLTPDNFGTLGDKPVHRELLDWLARRFVEGGWSVKAMHRTILLSSTYRMSDRDDPDAARVDPEGQYYWRWKGRRLEAEEIRDALLAVSGTLDPTMGGSLLHVKNREFFFDHTSKDKTRYDSRRRSIYLPVVRNNTYEVFQLFDFPDAGVTSGDRTTTTVAPQALFLINSDQVIDLTRTMARELLGRQDCDDAGRLRRLYETAVGRPPTEAETARASAFLARVEAGVGTEGTKDEGRRLSAWQALCQVLVSSNEFFYVR